MSRKQMFVLIFSFVVFISLASVFYMIVKKEPKPKPRFADITYGLLDEECASVLPAGEVVYAGGVDGLYKLRADTLELIEKVANPSGPEFMLVWDLLMTADGVLWVAHNKGISVIQNGAVTTFSTADGLLDPRANVLTTDGGGNIWAGTWGGAYCFAKRGDSYAIIKSFTGENGLTDNMVNSIYADNDGGLWFGAYYHGGSTCGLSIYRNGKFSYLSTGEGLPHKFITGILPYGDRVYVGCGYLERGGLAAVKTSGGAFTVEKTFTAKDGLPGEKVRTLFTDSTNRLWICTESDGILIVSDPGTLDGTRLSGTYATEENGLSDNEIKGVYETGEFFYLAARRGITRIPKTSVDRYIGEAIH